MRGEQTAARPTTARRKTSERCFMIRSYGRTGQDHCEPRRSPELPGSAGTPPYCGLFFFFLPPLPLAPPPFFAPLPFLADLVSVDAAACVPSVGAATAAVAPPPDCRASRDLPSACMSLSVAVALSMVERADCAASSASTGAAVTRPSRIARPMPALRVSFMLPPEDAFEMVGLFR